MGATYREGKAAVNEMVKAQGFRHRTILKPALMMHKMLPPVADFMLASLSNTGHIDTAFEPRTKIDWIAAQDIGAFAAADFTPLREPSAKPNSYKADDRPGAFELPKASTRDGQWEP